MSRKHNKRTNAVELSALLLHFIYCSRCTKHCIYYLHKHEYQERPRTAPHQQWGHRHPLPRVRWGGEKEDLKGGEFPHPQEIFGMCLLLKELPSDTQ